MGYQYLGNPFSAQKPMAESVVQGQQIQENNQKAGVNSQTLESNDQKMKVAKLVQYGSLANAQNWAQIKSQIENEGLIQRGLMPDDFASAQPVIDKFMAENGTNKNSILDDAIKLGTYNMLVQNNQGKGIVRPMNNIQSPYAPASPIQPAQPASMYSPAPVTPGLPQDYKSKIFSAAQGAKGQPLPQGGVNPLQPATQPAAQPAKVQPSTKIDEMNQEADLYDKAQPAVFDNNSSGMQLPDGRFLTQAQFDKEQGRVEKSRKYIDSTKKKLSVIPMIDDIMKEITSHNYETGFPGQVLGGVGGTGAARLEAMLEGVRSNLGFDNLTEMRQNSPTGGALGNISNFENVLLQSTKGTLQRSAGVAELMKTLKRIRDGYLDIGEKLGEDVNQYKTYDNTPQSGARPNLNSTIPSRAQPAAGATVNWSDF